MILFFAIFGWNCNILDYLFNLGNPDYIFSVAYICFCTFFFQIHASYCPVTFANFIFPAMIWILQCLNSLLQGRCSVLLTKSRRTKWGWSFHPFLPTEDLPRLFSPFCSIFLGLMLMEILLVLFSDVLWETDTAILHLLSSLKMNGKISLKEWTERVKRSSVRMKDWKRSFVFGHHIGDRHWQELVCYLSCATWIRIVFSWKN